MSLRTRLDSRSEKNNYFILCDEDGNELAKVAAASHKVELIIEAAEGIHIKKPNGFNSRRD